MVASAGQETTIQAASVNNERSDDLENVSLEGHLGPMEGGVEDNNNDETVRRGTPKSSGVYVKGKIQDISVWFTIDTGATRTVVSTRVFTRIKPEKRPDVTKDNIMMEQADGAALEILGTVKVNLQLGDYSITRDVIVANIKDDVLLGMDVGHKMDILTSQNKISIDGHEIACTHVQSILYRVVAADTYNISGESEQEVSVMIDDGQCRGSRLGEAIIEASSEFCKRHRMIAGRSLMDFNRNVRGKMR